MTSYDAMHYPYAVRAVTHPARLGAVAALFGREPVDAHACRVLEIGGGDGVNVVSMALHAPGSRFVSIDLAESAVARGKALVAALGLANVRVEAGDATALSDEVGPFDYIIAHGVYAWVPPSVRERLMAMLGRLLSPRGVAMVSYNALPGCHIRRAVRDIVRHAAEPFTQPHERVGAARKALAFHVARWDADDPAQAAVKREAERLLDKPDGVIAHDELSDEWHPQHVSDVVRAARANGLDYLGDSQTTLIGDALFSDPLFGAVRERTDGDFAAYEQIKDFADARMFRQTLLCRPGAPIERWFAAHRLDDLWAEARFEPLDVSDGIPVYRFRSSAGGDLSTTSAAFADTLKRLSAAWPASLPFREIAPDAETREALMRLFAAGAVGLSTTSFALCAQISEHPRASALARWQIAQGATDVTTLRHTSVRIESEASRRLLAMLDGTYTMRELEDAMVGATAEPRETAAAFVRTALADFVQFGLLES